MLRRYLRSISSLLIIAMLASITYSPKVWAIGPTTQMQDLLQQLPQLFPNDILPDHLRQALSMAQGAPTGPGAAAGGAQQPPPAQAPRDATTGAPPQDESSPEQPVHLASGTSDS